MALQALRNKIGDEQFWTLLRTWAGTRAGGNGTVARVRRAGRDGQRPGPGPVLRHLAAQHGPAGQDRRERVLRPDLTTPTAPSPGRSGWGGRSRDSSRSAAVKARRVAFTPSHRNGSGSHAGERWLTHGSRVSSVSRSSTRSRRVRPARLVVATPSPTYPPAQARPVERSSPTDAHQSRGTPSGPPHACETVVPAQHREQVDEGLEEVPEDRLVTVEPRPDPRAQVVRRAAAAEHDPVVGGALAVDDQVPEVGERLAPGQPDLVPDRRVDRLGRDDQGVDGDAGPPVPGQRRGEALGRADDGRAPGRRRGRCAPRAERST